VLGDPVNASDPTGLCFFDSWSCTLDTLKAFGSNLWNSADARSTAAGFVPGLGEYRDGRELIDGVDLETGEPLGWGQRGATAVGFALPLIPGSAVRRGFRKELALLTEGAEAGAHAHHVFPVKFVEQFAAAGIDIRDARFGAWWEATEHLSSARGYNEAWRQFLVEQPRSQEEMLEFGRNLAAQYGLNIHY
jgi:hypothetical protein